MRQALRVLPLALFMLLAAIAWASDPPTEEYAPPILKSFGRLSEHMDDAGWEQESEFINNALNGFWERNGWNSESDKFAHDVASEVAAIPPWQVMKRLNTLNKRFSDRYGLSDAQASQFQGAVIGETSGVLLRNIGVITKQIQEVLRSRADGQPFTAEQVARWMREGGPVMAELRQSADRLTRTLRPMLRPDKLEILDEDIASYEKRQKVVDGAIERWARGEWQPSDWGLENDPLHGRAAQKGGPPIAPGRDKEGRGSKPGRRARVARCVSYDPETWYACVLELKEQYTLDPGQKDTAESIHVELVERALAYVANRTEVLAKVPASEKKTHEAYEPVRMLFDELKSRLEVIPTTGQREESERRILRDRSRTRGDD